jgi:hypothetical protein
MKMEEIRKDDGIFEGAGAELCLGGLACIYWGRGFAHRLRSSTSSRQASKTIDCGHSHHPHTHNRTFGPATPRGHACAPPLCKVHAGGTRSQLRRDWLVMSIFCHFGAVRNARKTESRRNFHSSLVVRASLRVCNVRMPVLETKE